MNFGHIGDVQETLQHIIEDVNKGNLKAIAYVGIHEDSDGTVSFGWSAGVVKLELLGACEVLKGALLQAFEQVEGGDQ